MKSCATIWMELWRNWMQLQVLTTTIIIIMPIIERCIKKKQSMPYCIILGKQMGSDLTKNTYLHKRNRFKPTKKLGIKRPFNVMKRDELLLPAVHCVMIRWLDGLIVCRSICICHAFLYIWSVFLSLNHFSRNKSFMWKLIHNDSSKVLQREREKSFLHERKPEASRRLFKRIYTLHHFLLQKLFRKLSTSTHIICLPTFKHLTSSSPPPTPTVHGSWCHVYDRMDHGDMEWKIDHVSRGGRKWFRMHAYVRPYMHWGCISLPLGVHVISYSVKKRKSEGSGNTKIPAANRIDIHLEAPSLLKLLYTQSRTVGAKERKLSLKGCLQSSSSGAHSVSQIVMLSLWRNLMENERKAPVDSHPIFRSRGKENANEWNTLSNSFNCFAQTNNSRWVTKSTRNLSLLCMHWNSLLVTSSKSGGWTAAVVPMHLSYWRFIRCTYFVSLFMSPSLYMAVMYKRCSSDY